MKRFKSGTLLLLSAMPLIGLTGCGQAEQAANSTIEKAKQSASQVIDEGKQSVGNMIGQTGEGTPQDSSEKDTAENQPDDAATEQTADKDKDD